MTLDRSGLRVLTTAECLQLLETVSLGRVALSHRALPMILPVHFAMLDDRIVVHAMAGTTLDRTTDDAVVAFEAEGPPGATDPVWSVVVHGFATHRFCLPPPDTVRIEISTDQVTGREVLLDRGLLRPGTFAPSGGLDSGGMLRP
jgi:hypothetical protein